MILFYLFFMALATHIKPISGCSFSIKKVYKEGILWSLQKRNQSEVQRFSNIEHAIGMVGLVCISVKI